MCIAQENGADDTFDVATVGNRLVFSRNPLPESSKTDQFGIVSFIDFHGCCPDRAVRMIPALRPNETSTGVQRRKCVLAYETLTTVSRRNLISDDSRQSR